MQKVVNSLAVFTDGNPENRPIILIHGFPYDHTMWENQINAFKKDYYCISYDVRGLGESYVGDGQYTMEAYVDDLFSIIYELQLDKPVLCGLSIGGYISLRAVERNESNFSGLILCDTRSESDNDEGKLVRASKINQINVDGLEKFVEEFVPVCFSEEAPVNNPDVFNNTMNIAKNSNPIGVKGAILAMLGRTDTTQFLEKIKIPALLVVGSFDRITPPPAMRAMAEKIENSDLAIAPGAGHMAPLENPGFVNDVISCFMKKHF